MDRFFLILSYMTCLPVPLKRIMTEEDLGHGTRWFPVAGAVIGAGLCLVVILAESLWTPVVAGIAAVSFWAFITRGLHLDGVADIFDALGGGATRDRALEILKDSRIGAFGAIALFCLLGIKWAVIVSLNREALAWLFVAPIVARWSVVLAIFWFPPARPDGMGRRFTAACGRLEVLVASTLAAAFVFPLMGLNGLIPFGVSALGMALVGWRLNAVLGGLTGDCYGCIGELVEVAVLLVGIAI
ncbi:MAG: adenosylcobinamide-GDP ribazoletransferase [Dethiosulfovibrio peptidovorans]|nr:MAG: adenosylcobinamide-GDP ribazoletransferase [Dethiosulfovibrio peptidovorans]